MIQHFDPKGMSISQGANGVFNAKTEQVESGYFTIKATRTGSGITTPIQLFGALAGIHLRKSEDFAYVPYLSKDLGKLALTQIAANLASAADFAAFKTSQASWSSVYDGANNANVTKWAENGDLIIQVNASQYVTISCEEMPYRELLKKMESTVVVASSIQFSYTNQVSLNNKIDFKRLTMLGDDTNGSILPRASFKPDQNQGLIVSIDRVITLDSSTELNTVMHASETELTYLFNVTSYSQNAWQNRA
jgi:hypothetical protein